eukprot:TRINITY_DN9376_c0_g1_i1.p1 TRINITY_DN9376_c0_g1~~TRINITY_DN9376_c0_g1_i1.p1  ORF type:complete len:193 (-),score=38.18 TRINITY_DN9376_c0_g1_i1:102-617(-)
MALRSIFAASLLSVASADKCYYPGGQCFELSLQKCKGHDWSIHGLWAQWQNGCDGPEFDFDKLSSIRDELESVWFSCEGEKSETFWAHEWQKHGTCSGLDQLDYFKKAIQLFKENENQCGGRKLSHHHPGHGGGGGGGGEQECKICFTKDLSSTEDCPGQEKEATSADLVV